MEFAKDSYASIDDNGSTLCEHNGEIFIIEGEISAPCFEAFTEEELEMLKEPDFIPF